MTEINTTQLINQIGICNNIKEKYPIYFNYFKELLENYPEKYEKDKIKKDKIKNMINLKIDKNNKYKTLTLFYTNDNENYDDVSYNKCIRNKKGLKEIKIDFLNKALRDIIEPQILDFKKKCNYDFECEFCKVRGSDSNEFHVDHITHFSILKNSFFKIYNLKPENITYDRVELYVILHDKQIEINWFNYHKDNCKLRILCKKCNEKRGNRD